MLKLCGNEVVRRPSMPTVALELRLLYESIMGIRGKGLDEPHKVITGAAFINVF
jgi:hypothetical protein